MTQYFNPNIFRESEIRKELCHRLPDFLNLVSQKVRIVDFLSHIKSRSDDQKILRNWMAYFKMRDVPFAVTLTKGWDRMHYVLWKKDEALRTKEEMNKERAKPGARWFKEGDNKVYE